MFSREEEQSNLDDYEGTDLEQYGYLQGRVDKLTDELLDYVKYLEANQKDK